MLYDLFSEHPNLIPKNVSFNFDWCDYFEEHWLNSEPCFFGKPIQGTGLAWTDYQTRARSFVQQSIGSDYIGKSISGAIYASQTSHRGLLTSTPKPPTSFFPVQTTTTPLPEPASATITTPSAASETTQPTETTNNEEPEQEQPYTLFGSLGLFSNEDYAEDQGISCAIF